MPLDPFIDEGGIFTPTCLASEIKAEMCGADLTEDMKDIIQGYLFKNCEIWWQ